MNSEDTRLVVGYRIFALNRRDADGVCSWKLYSELDAKVYNSSLSADGTVVVIGEVEQATITLFQEGVMVGKLVGERGVGETFQGWSVAVNHDGSIVVRGGSRDNGVGAGWVYSNKT